MIKLARQRFVWFGIFKGEICHDHEEKFSFHRCFGNQTYCVRLDDGVTCGRGSRCVGGQIPCINWRSASVENVLLQTLIS